MADAKIADALSELAEDVSELHVHPDNARRGNVDEILASLERFGQVRPILALPDGTVIAGNHVFLAAQRLGWERIAVVREDLDEKEAKAYLLADNRLAELGGYDQEALGSLLQDLAATDLPGTGYVEDSVSNLLAKLNPAGPEEFPDHSGGVETDTTCPRCGFQWASGETRS